MAFLDEVRAMDHRVYHRLSKTRVVVLAGAIPAKTPAPQPAVIQQKPAPEKPLMKAKKNKVRISKETEAKVITPQPAEEKSRSRQLYDVSIEKPAVELRTTKSENSSNPAPVQLETVVEANVDVGFGNALFIRGQGAELSWDKGQPLNCVDGKTWQWSTRQAKNKLVFKLVLNDVAWSAGDDVVAEPGKKIELVPKF